MARREGQWGPDTCQCWINYTFDPDVPGNLELDYVIKKCKVHEDLHSDQLWRQVRHENAAKNDALGFAREATAPRLQVARVTPDGPEMIDAPHIRWEFHMEPLGPGRQRVVIRLRGDTLLSFERRDIERRIAQAMRPVPIEIAPDEA